MIKKPLQLISATRFSKMIGTSKANVTTSGRRALNETYRGSFPCPDAVDDEGRMFWFPETVEKYLETKKKDG